MDRRPHDGRLQVLVVDHTAELAGGEVALLRLLDAVDHARFDVSVLLLAQGPLVEQLRGRGIRTAVLSARAELVEASRTDVARSLRATLSSAVHTLGLVTRVAAAIRGSGAHLVVANTLKAAVLVAGAAPLARRRWVWHLHDRLAPDYLPAMLVRMMRTIARIGPRTVVANSHATAETLVGVPASRVVVAYPGLPVGTGAARPQEVPHEPAFGIIGRIGPTKGQDEFLHAAALVSRSDPNVSYTVIGRALFNDAPYEARVRDLPASLGIADRVRFAGWLAQPVNAAHGFTALVHASPVPEPFGQVISEGMLAGVPVIAADAGGVPEILDPMHARERVADGVDRTPLGLLVRPADPQALASAMQWAAHHPDAMVDAASRARESARSRFDIRVIARTVESAWVAAAGTAA